MKNILKYQAVDIELDRLTKQKTTYDELKVIERMKNIVKNAQNNSIKLEGEAEELLKEYDTENADEVDMFNINYQIACRIGQILYRDKTKVVEEEQTSATDELYEQPNASASQSPTEEVSPSDLGMNIQSTIKPQLQESASSLPTFEQ